ncbi:DNA-binding GntR family transcriptional regulator [Mesorhizobium sp. J18]|uniref:GntR family transcriptional regulator n=1 Tax=Mesorhizobium sp. J18 TaxID=935263 RepID=UPI00119A565D|nr:GntR family transcriptional regulator [Mesorhizobium sp. J18]TWG97942.1 DNA-binding GntR family transcriptional regulator [Mesorhizobium sp. J18]
MGESAKNTKNQTAGAVGSSPRLYQRAFDILAGQIARGELAAGTELKETGIAAQFGISRAPARRALAELAEAGLVERRQGQGFIVSRLRNRAGIGKRNSRSSPAANEVRLVSLPSWERIYGEVESEIAARISFATWRVNEAELARHYRVSRTVARDVIGRLQQRGLLRKDDRSRWYAQALTPDHVGELYELRWLLEPVALRKAAPNVPRELLQAMRDRLGDALANAHNIDGATLDRLEHDLHVTLLGYCGNQTLMQAITLPQSLLIAHHFLYRWTARLFDIEPLLPEHIGIIDRLLAERIKDASTALERHLRVSRDRAIARIDVIARGAEPDPLPYLIRSASVSS